MDVICLAVHCDAASEDLPQCCPATQVHHLGEEVQGRVIASFVAVVGEPECDQLLLTHRAHQVSLGVSPPQPALTSLTNRIITRYASSARTSSPRRVNTVALIR